MRKLTAEILIELGFRKGKRNGKLFFQKGNIILLYIDSGVWEFAAEHGLAMSSGIVSSTEQELNELING